MKFGLKYQKSQLQDGCIAKYGIHKKKIMFFADIYRFSTTTNKFKLAPLNRTYFLVKHNFSTPDFSNS